MSKHILVSGATGSIGSVMIPRLQKKGYRISILSRSSSNPFDDVTLHQWDPKSGTLDDKALDGVDIVLNMAGAGIGDKKWTRERKKVILESRLHALETLKNAVERSASKPTQLLSISAVGYYGYDTGSILVKEGSRFGDDFLATVAKSWESKAAEFESLGLQVAILRLGIVLTPTGGALEKMEGPVKLGLGAALGRGDQYISWIHELDVSNLVDHVIKSELSGIYNAVSPSPETNKAFMKALAKAHGKPFFLPNVPGFVLKLILGQSASMVLGGNRVSSEKITNTGFGFEFDQLDDALQNLVKR